MSAIPSHQETYKTRLNQTHSASHLVSYHQRYCEQVEGLFTLKKISDSYNTCVHMADWNSDSCAWCVFMKQSFVVMIGVSFIRLASLLSSCAMHIMGLIVHCQSTFQSVMPGWCTRMRNSLSLARQPLLRKERERVW